MNPIATRKVFTLNRETNEEGEILFEILTPEAIDNDENYLCTVRITGPESVVQKIGGIDSMQALSLAVAWTKNTFDNLKKEKYDFFWSKGKEYSMDSFDYSLNQDH